MSNNTFHTKTKNNSPQQKTSEKKQSLQNVRQDKYAFRRVRVASRQPVILKTPARTQRLNNSKPRSQKGDVTKNGSVPLTLYLEPIVKEKLQRYAKEQGISFHKAAATLIERSIQEKIIREQIELIKPIIENTIAKEMQETYETLESLEDRRLPKKPIRRKN
jgi:membrane-bound lytic murein transglycosylase